VDGSEEYDSDSATGWTGRIPQRVFRGRVQRGTREIRLCATKAAAASLVESVAQEEDADEIRFVQVLPAGMVDTPGIRARRPADFDYSDYMTPADFKPFAGNLVESRAKDMAGDVFVVAKGGSWHSLHDGVPVSQSRALS
jgi:NAD(P)-dependent dehydrogenase (short-subunit alcohol dehydrogenase family)